MRLQLYFKFSVRIQSKQQSLKSSFTRLIVESFDYGEEDFAGQEAIRSGLVLVAVAFDVEGVGDVLEGE